MSISRILGVLVILSTAAAMTACGDDDSGDGGGGGNIQELCDEYCDKVEPLACPATPDSTCEADCEGQLGQIPEVCRSEGLAYARCSLNRPLSDWECDEFDEASLKEGVCAAQNEAIEECFQDFLGL